MKRLLLILAAGAVTLAQTPAHTPHYPNTSNGVVLYGAEGAYTPSSLWSTINNWLGDHFDWILGGGGTGDPHGTKPGNLTHTYYATYTDMPRINMLVGYAFQTSASSHGFVLENMFLHANVDSALTAYSGTNRFDAFEPANSGGTLSDGVFTYNGSIYADVTTPSWSGGTTTIANTLYVGYMEPFDQMKFVISSARVGGTVAYQYCNAAAAGSCTNWATLTPRSDSTSALAATGQVYFYPPADWVQNTLTVNVSPMPTTNLKYWVRAVVAGATSSPVYRTLKGDNWSAASTGNTFRGWNATDSHRINVGTRLEYNPTPPANATAKFRYQARATNTGTTMFGNPADVQNGIVTWAQWLADATDAQLTPANGFDAAFFDDSPPSMKPKNADATLDYDHNYTADWGNVAMALSAMLKGEHGSSFWITYNGQGVTANGSMVGDANLLETVIQPGNYYTRPATINPYPGYNLASNSPYDLALPANNPNNAKMFVQYYDGSTLTGAGASSSAWNPSGGSYFTSWHFTDRGNRTPLLTLAMHYIGSNINTGFMYDGGGEVYAGYYEGVDEVNTYDTPTTLAAPITANTSTTATKTISLASPDSCVGRIYPQGGVTAQIGNQGDVVQATFGTVIQNGSNLSTQLWGGYPATAMPQYPNIIIQAGYAFPFSHLSFSFTEPSQTNGTQTWVYWNGSTWAPLTVTDGTNKFHQNGTVTWTAPGDWATTTLGGVTGYFVQVTLQNYIHIPTVSTIRSSDWTTFTTTSPIYNSYPAGTPVYCIQSQHLSTVATPPVSNVWGWTRWFPAMAVDIGTPDANGYRGGARAINETGNTPWLYGSAISGHTPLSDCGTTACPDVWRRDFTNAIVLMRPWRSGMHLEAELDTYSQPIVLGGTYYQLKADGTMGPAVTSVTLRGGEAAILMKIPPVISCNAGAQQTLRAGFPAQLDGSGSYAQDGGPLNYVWQRLSGPSAVRWSSRTVAQPVVSGLVTGSYVFQLTVTQGVSHSATCTVKQGVVASGDNGVVVANSPAVDTLLGPLIRLGANPWPWYDDRNEADANLQMAAMDENYPAWWDVSGPGTVAVAPGSNAITGAGTTFTTTFCQGPGDPHTPKGNAVIAVWYQTGVPGQTGRRMSAVTGCADDADLTVDDAWDVGVIPAGSGLNYAADDDSTHYATNWGWGQAGLPGNYEDNVAGYNALYYRSGIDDYLDAAHKLADRVWRSPMVDRGASQVPGHSGSYGYPGRSLSALGLVLRAVELQGTPSDMWAGLHKIWDASMTYLNSAGTSPDPRGGDTLDKAYHLAMVSYCALFDSDPAYQSNCQAAISSSFSSIWTPAESADGSWPQLYYTTSSWDTNTSASLVNGSTAVVGDGTVWDASAFPSTIWLTNAPGSMPPNNQGGDATTYTATFVDATHLQLDRPYAGTSGAHGWVLASDMIGWGAQPSVMGTLAAAFDLASKAIAGTDPANSALASNYNQVAVNWIQTYGYWPLEKGLYNAAQGVNCQAPIDDNNTACTGGNSLEAARALNAGVLRGIMAAYASSQSTGLRDFANTLYNSMFAKPGTCPSGSLLCIPDGSYLSGMDGGGPMMTEWPPQGNEWFGTFFGFNELSAWPAYEAGGPGPTNPRAYYVSFNAAAVRGAAKVRVIATEPSGRALQSDCATSPCRVVVDGQQGDPLIEVWYLSNTGAVLAKTPMAL